MFESSSFSGSDVVRFKNINELRLMFALSVLISHAIQLGQFASYDILRTIFSSEIAVQGFFILSGFLVFGSYSRMLNIRSFYMRRFFRIYPGYVMALILFLFFALIQSYLYGQEVAGREVARYFGFNLLLLNFLQPSIDGVFQLNPYHDINGALWTIKIEVMFYALVPLLYWIGRRWSLRFVAVTLILVGLSWRPLLDLVSLGGWHLHPSFAHQLPGQLHFFGFGILMFDASVNNGHWIGNVTIVIVATLLAGLIGAPSVIVRVLLLSLFCFGITQLPQMNLPLGDRDLSYGIYLSHFPIIQLLIGAGIDGLGAELFMPLVLLLSVAYAIVSWKCVELPALQFSRRILK